VCEKVRECDQLVAVVVVLLFIVFVLGCQQGPPTPTFLVSSTYTSSKHTAGTAIHQLAHIRSPPLSTHTVPVLPCHVPSPPCLSCCVLHPFLRTQCLYCPAICPPPLPLLLCPPPPRVCVQNEPELIEELLGELATFRQPRLGEAGTYGLK